MLFVRRSILIRSRMALNRELCVWVFRWHWVATSSRAAWFEVLIEMALWATHVQTREKMVTNHIVLLTADSFPSPTLGLGLHA